MFMAFTGVTYFPDLSSLIGIAACGSGSSHWLAAIVAQVENLASSFDNSFASSSSGESINLSGRNTVQNASGCI